MPQLNAYLNFNGNCAEAMRFYEKTFGGTLRLMTQGESPMAAQLPPGDAQRVLHAHLEFEGNVLMAADCMSSMPYNGMHGFGIALNTPTAAAAQQLFDALGAGGKVTMPLQKTFWAEAFGMLTDRYGTHWLVNGGGITTA
jgi:PhnB protein